MPVRALLLGFLLTCHAFANGGFIWIEGEKPASTNMTPHPWYAGAVVKADLSGGDFISNFGPAEGDATYRFAAEPGGAYHFWLRANPVGDPKLDFRLNGGPWIPVNFSHPLDLVNIAKDGKPDLRFIAWIDAGEVSLQPGGNTIDFRFHSANNNHGSLDCFLFTQSPFTPNGKLKPGEKMGSQEPGWWSFEPGPERFGADALLDLRPLNEAAAGQSGFVRADGDEFRLGNGQSVRFWAVNTGAPADNLTNDQMDFMAARFAKLGINMVRIHGGLFDREASDPEKIDLGRLDRYFYLINAFRKQGIYVHLSTYFPLWLKVKPSDGIPGTEDIYGKIPFGLLIFEPRMQEIYKSWLRQILTTRNPYTGRTLAQEPAVGVFEIQNEDSLFFWTFNPASLGKGPRELLEKKFAVWLTRKYGSLPRAFAAWPGEKHPDDGQDRAGLYGAFEMSSAGFPKQSSGRQKRLLDQIHFLAQLQHDFYVGMRDYLRNDLGARWPISASNWTTAPGLGFIERYTYSGVDVIDRHGYFGGKHEGEGAGWSVRAGQTYGDRTAMYDPTSVPFQYVRLPGHPHIQTEIAWNKPNRFIAEGEPLISAYESLQDINGVYLFAAANGDWLNNGGGNWTYMMPGEIGQSPAEALQYRRGDLAPGAVILRQVTSLNDLLDLKSSNLIEGPNADFRMADAPKAALANQSSAFDPLAYFVGRVERTFDPAAQPINTDLSPYIDRAAKRITSSTGQLVWDYGRGLVTVNSPRSQAVIGFIAGSNRLGNVVINSGNQYGAIHVISLDGLPIATSRRLLIQAFTEEKMSGFQSSGGRILNIGHPPILVRDISATVTLPAAPNLRAIALDEQGYPRTELHPQLTVTAATIPLPTNSLYTVVIR
ncbi:MAG TPA: hypothetical protein VHY22_06650 [Chthoniobacteraceae bacterium]|jgi:hypothetical protein|nr:hypothetical protein [Chthoniobacteraceae bacterium]